VTKVLDVITPGSPIPEGHTMNVTEHILECYPGHEPREGDPHYKHFNAARVRLKRLGMLRCWIGNTDCAGQIELHHTMVEFALTNGVDVQKFEEEYPEFAIRSDEEFLTWCQGEGNLTPLCFEGSAPVTMGDGRILPIKDVKAGDWIMGADTRPHLVSRVPRRRYTGELVELRPDVWATPEHPVLTCRGWVAAGDLRQTDFFHAVGNPGPDIKLRPAGFVFHPKVDDIVTGVHKIQVAPSIDLRAPIVPIRTVHLDQEIEGRHEAISGPTSNRVIGHESKTSDGEHIEKPTLKKGRLLRNTSTLSIFRVKPHAMSRAVFTRVFLTRPKWRSTQAAGEGECRPPRELVQGDETTGVRAVTIIGSIVNFAHRALKRRSALLADKNVGSMTAKATAMDATARLRACLPCGLRMNSKTRSADDTKLDLSLTRTFGWPCEVRDTGGNSERASSCPERGAFPAAFFGACNDFPDFGSAKDHDLSAHFAGDFDRHRGMGASATTEQRVLSTGIDDKISAATLANLFDARPWGTANPLWVPAGGLRRVSVHDLIVIDIMMETHHCFQAGGITVHNCFFHHRGIGGVHALPGPLWLPQRFWKAGMSMPGRLIR
jgi:hypothetical protein